MMWTEGMEVFVGKDGSVIALIVSSKRVGLWWPVLSYQKRGNFFLGKTPVSKAMAIREARAMLANRNRKEELQS